MDFTVCGKNSILGNDYSPVESESPNKDHEESYRVTRLNSIAVECPRRSEDNGAVAGQETAKKYAYVTSSFPLELMTRKSESTSTFENSFSSEREKSPPRKMNGSRFTKATSNIAKSYSSTIYSSPVGEEGKANVASYKGDLEQGGPPITPAKKFSLVGFLGGRRKTSNCMDIRQNIDALPTMENYRNKSSFRQTQRPTIDDLRENKYRIGPKEGDEPGVDSPPNTMKFGWIEGCLVRCLLNIWGVMLFLRLSWMVGHAGIWQSLVIIAISTAVTTITTLSMSAVSTNGEMKGGGLYYMIARSLGPEWGGAVGVVFSFANAGMAALNTVGFSEAIITLLAEYDLKIIDGSQNDNRIISCIAIVALQAIIVVGMEWEAKAQVGLLLILLVAMGDFIIGAFMPPQGTEEIAKGWIGLNGTLFTTNLQPAYKDQDFFSIFSIFFPAVAGIQAGASISGDLKDAAEAIPKGTLLAIFITSGSYAVFAILAGTGTLREASGIVTEAENGSWEFANCSASMNRTCHWGLYNDFQVMGLMSAFAPIIYAGCFASTLSSALSCLVSGPKTFQALCKDKVYPYMSRFGVGYGKADDPYWSYALGFIIALIFILIADLNAIAPLISNFFMATYALLNFCTFHAALVKPLGWRPTFKYYNTWVSLIGAILCVAVMFLMDWKTALISIGCTLACFGIVIYRKPDLNWGTSCQAQTYTDALTALEKLAVTQDHVKNFRPQILCLTGALSHRPTLVDFAYLLTKNHSLLMCGNIVNERQEPKVRRSIIQSGYDWMLLRKVKGFYVMVDNCSFDEGAQAIMQTSGIGKLAPNIILMGYKENWQVCPREERQEYFYVMHGALDNYIAIAILRVKGGLDCSHNTGPKVSGRKRKSSATTTGSVPNLCYDKQTFGTNPDLISEFMNSKNTEESRKPFQRKMSKSVDHLDTNVAPKGSELQNDAIDNLYRFQTTQTGNIDVWWLYDDGGLTLLLPYIISTRKRWHSCKLRVFALSNKKDQLEEERSQMTELLSKFRIDYSDLKIIPDIDDVAKDDTQKFFRELVKDFQGNPDQNIPDTVIGDNELIAMKEKTNRHMRLRELLLEHSANSNLIVMTLLVPQKGSVSAPLYMAWLETLTRDMPPFLLVRGNQTAVLTFYL